MVRVVVPVDDRPDDRPDEVARGAAPVVLLARFGRRREVPDGLVALGEFVTAGCGAGVT